MTTTLDTYTSTAPTAPQRHETLDAPERVDVELARAFDDRRRQLRRCWDESGATRQTIRQIVQYASGDQLSTAPLMPAETAQHWRQKPSYAANFLGVAVDKLSTLYTASPLRDVSNAPTWRRILWPELDATLARQDGLVHLTGTVAAVVEPRWGEDARSLREAMAGMRDRPEGLGLRYFGPDRWVAIPDDLDPSRPGAIAVHWQTIENDGGDRHQIHYYWDDTTIAVLRDWSVQWSAPHGMDVVPVALLANTDEDGLYGRPMGGRDLVSNSRAVTGYFREVVHTARLQRGQPYSKGKIKNPNLGPDSLLEVDLGGDFAFASNGADLPGMLDTLERMLAAFALSLGLPRGTFQLTGSLDLAADHTELARYRQRRALVARRWEREIHRVAAAVWQRFTGQALNPRGLHVTYVEEPPPMTVSDRLALAEFGLRHGLRDEVDTARALWPHMSGQEIEAMVARGLAAQERRVAQQATVAGHARDVDGGVGDPENGTRNREDDERSSGSAEPDAGVDSDDADSSPAG